MAVIGRLDEQVDRVLITPVSKKEREDAHAQDEMPQRSPRPAEQAEHEPDARPDHQTAEQGRELPVWLL